MESQTNNEKSCPCCGRHCPVDKLHCPRGKEYFETGGYAKEHSFHRTERHEHHVPAVKDETVKLMLKCGHSLHHGLAEKSDDILSFLSTDEKNELTRLLNKCLEHWN